MELDQNTLLYFFSNTAQVFGALLGLVGLTYIRITDNINQNLEDNIRQIFDVISKNIGAWEKENGQTLEIHAQTPDEIEKVFNEHEDKFNPIDYGLGIQSKKNLEVEVAFLKKQSKNFKILCFVLVANIILAISANLGVNFLLTLSREALYSVVLFLFLLAANGIILTGRHFISMTTLSRTKSFYQ